MNNPYQAPRTGLLENHGTHIDALDVSATWKQRFHLIERAGGIMLPRFKELTFGERMKTNFNILAVLFGPIYFLIKGMWKLALTYVGAMIVLAVILGVFGLEKMARGAGIGLGVAFGMRANLVYYSKKVLGIDRWF